MRSRKKEGVYSMSILKRQVLFVLFAFAATLCAFAQNKTITGLVVDGNGESIHRCQCSCQRDNERNHH